MAKLCPLFSGSSGNSYYIEASGSGILVDCLLYTSSGIWTGFAGSAAKRGANTGDGLHGHPGFYNDFPGGSLCMVIFMNTKKRLDIRKGREW